MKRFLPLLFFFATLYTASAQIAPSSVDLNQYSGKWFVISSIPTRFDKNWNYVTESYTLKDNGKIAIYTTYKKVGDPETKDVKSKGFPKKKSNNVTWKVQFVWPFRVDYLVEEIGPDYSYVVVGHPKKSYLYIMNRTGKMDEQLYQTLVKRYQEKGYATKDLRMVIQ